mmetsp:Transcript_40205/g.108620  ORF Transcript_40205/g.108620 Transcript_40205/m.108620 type:complete len:246 (+) Transcript_40205:645-1382(+)
MGAMLAAHLEHVWVGPTAGAREPLVRPLRGCQEVEDHAAVGAIHVTARPVEIPGAPSGVGHGLAPVTVLDHHTAACPIDQLCPEVQIKLPAAPVQLHTVKPQDCEGGHVAVVHVFSLSLLAAHAIVPVPAHGQAELVGVARHRDHVGEALLVDDGGPGVVVVVVLAAPAALLPAVIQSDVAVAYIAQRCRDTVHHPLFVHDGIHDGHHERLVHVSRKEVPGTPTHRRCQAQPIVDGLHGQAEERQ